MPRRKAAEEVAETKEIAAAESTEKKRRGRKNACTIHYRTNVNNGNDVNDYGI